MSGSSSCLLRQVFRRSAIEPFHSHKPFALSRATCRTKITPQKKPRRNSPTKLQRGRTLNDPLMPGNAGPFSSTLYFSCLILWQSLCQQCCIACWTINSLNNNGLQVLVCRPRKKINSGEFRRGTSTETTVSVRRQFRVGRRRQIALARVTDKRNDQLAGVLRSRGHLHRRRNIRTS